MEFTFHLHLKVNFFKKWYECIAQVIPNWELKSRRKKTVISEIGNNWHGQHEKIRNTKLAMAKDEYLIYLIHNKLSVNVFSYKVIFPIQMPIILLVGFKNVQRPPGMDLFCTPLIQVHLLSRMNISLFRYVYTPWHICMRELLPSYQNGT